MYGCFICIHVYTTTVTGAHRGQKRVPDPLKLELQMVVLYYVAAGDRASVLCEGITVLVFLVFFFQTRVM